jgi:hypothetical protein
LYIFTGVYFLSELHQIFKYFFITPNFFII